MEPICQICGNSSDNEMYSAKEMMFGYEDEFGYFQCKKCGCLQITEPPVDISKYYPGGYYSFATANVSQRFAPVKTFLGKIRDHYAVFNRGLVGRLLFKRFPDSKLSQLSGLELSRESRILDVGCGSGQLLLRLLNLGFTNLLGVDPYIEEDIHYGKGLSILKRSIAQAPGVWDLIMFNHSFEHIWDQLSTLQHVSRLLSPDGTCLLSLPTVSSYAWERYRTCWVQLDAPRHFFLHSLISMDILSAKANMRVRNYRYNSTELQFWGSELYLRGIPMKSSRAQPVATKAELNALRKKAAKLDMEKRGDSVTFYLKVK